jgi:alkyldihydroxyacetonephosphate synthase
VAGPDLEAQLRAHGLTLGHFPQSFEQSTLGGWVATRSSGQQSAHYGRIERLFAGGTVETLDGPLVLPTFPASAAGPDLREVVLGSEGRVGVITEATVRVSALPEKEEFVGVFFPGWEQGLAASRALAQARLPLSLLRLSAPEEARTMLMLAGHERLLGALEAWIKFRGAGEGKALLIIGATGSRASVEFGLGEALSLVKRHAGISAGRTFGAQWTKNRFRAPYLRNSLWDLGYGVDTLETAAPWSAVPRVLRDVEAALRTGLDPWGEKAHVYTHLSHLYGDGSSVYTTYLFRLAPTPRETLERWQRLKARASEALVAAGGTISHQHGVGGDHARYLPAEKGPLGMKTLEGLVRGFDPSGLLNPGKLLR